MAGAEESAAGLRGLPLCGEPSSFAPGSLGEAEVMRLALGAARTLREAPYTGSGARGLVCYLGSSCPNKAWGDQRATSLAVLRGVLRGPRRDWAQAAPRAGSGSPMRLRMRTARNRAVIRRFLCRPCGKCLKTGRLVPGTKVTTRGRRGPRAPPRPASCLGGAAASRRTLGKLRASRWPRWPRLLAPSASREPAQLGTRPKW